MGIITAAEYASVKMCLCKYKSATQPLYWNNMLNVNWFSLCITVK